MSIRTMRSATALSLALFVSSCTSVAIRTTSTLEVARPDGAVRVEYESIGSQPSIGVAALCLVTGIIYGGTCWYYLALPDPWDKEKEEKLVREVASELGTCAKPSFVRVERIDWSFKPRETRLLADDGAVLRPDEFRGMCDPGADFVGAPISLLPAENDLVTMSAAAVCRRRECFGFALDVKNRTAEPVELLWEKTQYVDGEQTRGGFIVEGVQYVQRETLRAPAIILPNASYKQIVLPSVLVESPSWTHQPLGRGKKGIAVTVKHGAVERLHVLLFNVDARSAQAKPPPATASPPS